MATRRVGGAAYVIPRPISEHHDYPVKRKPGRARDFAKEALFRLPSRRLGPRERNALLDYLHGTTPLNEVRAALYYEQARHVVCRVPSDHPIELWTTLEKIRQFRQRPWPSLTVAERRKVMLLYPSDDATARRKNPAPLRLLKGSALQSNWLRRLPAKSSVIVKGSGRVLTALFIESEDGQELTLRRFKRLLKEHPDWFRTRAKGNADEWRDSLFALAVARLLVLLGDEIGLREWSAKFRRPKPFRGQSNSSGPLYTHPRDYAKRYERAMADLYESFPESEQSEFSREVLAHIWSR